MSLLGITSALLSPAVYAIVNFFDKFFLEKFKVDPLVITVYTGIIAFCVSIITILTIGFHILPLYSTIAVIMSGFFIELYLIPYFKALSLEDASTIVPLMQFTPIFIMLGEAFILKETLSFMQYIGAALIIASGLILSSNKVSFNIFKPRKAFWLMILAGLCTASSFLFFKFGVDNQSYWQILPYEGFGLFICSICILSYRSNYRAFLNQTKNLKKAVFPLMFINEGIYILAKYLALFAISFIPASLVAILAGIQPVFALMYGIILSLWFPFILKEVINKNSLILKISSIIAIMIGVIFLTI